MIILSTSKSILKFLIQSKSIQILVQFRVFHSGKDNISSCFFNWLLKLIFCYKALIFMCLCFEFYVFASSYICKNCVMNFWFVTFCVVVLLFYLNLLLLHNHTNPSCGSDLILMCLFISIVVMLIFVLKLLLLYCVVCNRWIYDFVLQQLYLILQRISSNQLIL